MIDENGTIYVRNSHGGGAVEFRPRLPKDTVAGPRMVVPIRLNQGKVHGWMRAARPGAKCVYHVGDLARDRDECIDNDAAKRTAAAEAVNKDAQAMLHYFHEGYVVLCQVPVLREDGKRGVGYHYIAVRTNQPFKEKQNVEGQAA